MKRSIIGGKDIGEGTGSMGIGMLDVRRRVWR